MNDYLKEIGEFAGLHDLVTLVHFKGSERIETTYMKFEVLTTHVARKTFITNAIERNMHSKVIMSITGHKTEKAFRRYYKIVDEQKLNAMKDAFRFKNEKNTTLV